MSAAFGFIRPALVAVAAWVWERAHSSIGVHLSPLAFGPIPFTKVPTVWALLPAHWRRLRRRCAPGVRRSGGLLVWVDNLFLPAGSWENAPHRGRQLHLAVSDLGLRFLGSSLEAWAEQWAGDLTFDESGCSGPSEWGPMRPPPCRGWWCTGTSERVKHGTEIVWLCAWTLSLWTAHGALAPNGGGFLAAEYGSHRRLECALGSSEFRIGERGE